MDPTLMAALITGLATIVGAAVQARAVKKAGKKDNEKFERFIAKLKEILEAAKHDKVDDQKFGRFIDKLEEIQQEAKLDKLKEVLETKLFELLERLIKKLKVLRKLKRNN